MKIKLYSFLLAGLCLLIATTSAVQAENTGWFSLGGGINGYGNTQAIFSASTQADATIRFLSVHRKAMGTSGGSAYCVTQSYKDNHHSNYVSSSGQLPGSNSGYDVSRHAWVLYNNNSSDRYTSHDGNHSSYSDWALNCP